MATLLPARLIPVNCAQLQLGMYVAELDRSWLHTSFHAHGFMLSHAEQVEELQRLCAYVYVDPVLSEQVGDDETFSTGLTARVEALPDGDSPAPLARQRLELRTDLLLGLDPLAEGADARMPAREVAMLGGEGVLASVDDRIELVLGMPNALSCDGRLDDFVGYLHRRLAEQDAAGVAERG